MDRGLRTLGLAFLVVLAIAAWAAAAAHAELEFQALETLQYGESEEEQEDVPVPATLHATQVAEEPIAIRIGEAKIQCTTATATATLSTGSSPTLDLAPSYSGCKLGGALTTEVKTEGCGFHVDLLEEVEATLFSAQTDIVCPGKSEILATVKFLGKTSCLIHIPAQTGLKTVKAITMLEDSPDDFTLKHEVSSLKANVKNGEVSCPITPGEYTKAELTGNTLVTANGTGEGVPPVKVQPRPVEKIHFGVEKEDVWIVGKVLSKQVFGFGLGKVECAAGQAFQNVESPTKTISILNFAPLEKYEECEHPSSGKATEVLFKGCGFELVGNVLNKSPLTGGLRVACMGGGMQVRINEFCKILIPEQLGLNDLGIRRVAFYNEGTGKKREIGVEFKIVGLEYEENNEMGCQQPNVRRKDGTITGTYFFQAFEKEGEEKQVGLWAVLTP